MRRFIFLCLVLVLSACGDSGSNNDNNAANNGANNGTSGTNNGTSTTGTNGTTGTNNDTSGSNNTTGTNNGTATTGTNNETGGTNAGGDIMVNVSVTNINPAIDGTLDVTLTFQNFALAAAVGGDNVAGEGHYAVFLDTIDADHELLRTVDNPATVTMTLANVDIAAGPANLMVEVYQNDMTSFDNPVIVMIPVTITE